jgi:hypothetical protein
MKRKVDWNKIEELWLEGPEEKEAEPGKETMKELYGFLGICIGDKNEQKNN